MNIFSTIPLRAEIGARAASVYGEWRNFFKRWSRSPTNRTSRENNKCETRTVEEARTGTESPDVLSTPPSKRQRRAATLSTKLTNRSETDNKWRTMVGPEARDYYNSNTLRLFRQSNLQVGALPSLGTLASRYLPVCMLPLPRYRRWQRAEEKERKRTEQKNRQYRPSPEETVTPTRRYYQKIDVHPRPIKTKPCFCRYCQVNQDPLHSM